MGMKDYEIFRARVGEVVKRRREAAGQKQPELAHDVGIDQANISRIECGIQGWDSDTIFELGRALKCSLADLFAEVEQVVPETLPAEAIKLAKAWMGLPRQARDEYQQRIEALASAYRHPVQDEQISRKPKARGKAARSRSRRRPPSST